MMVMEVVQRWYVIEDPVRELKRGPEGYGRQTSLLWLCYISHAGDKTTLARVYCNSLLSGPGR